MPKRRPITDRPVSEAVAFVVAGHLDAARRALTRDDVRGLHAFRVALRRARATLRAYRRWLPEVRRKDLRRLRRLARTTNAGRDAEVLLPLLARIATHLSRTERAHLTPLRRRLRRAHRETAKSTKALRDSLGDISRPLRRRLRRAAESPISFGEALGRLLAADADELATDLAALRDSDAPAAFHAARLAVKRLRYLLEPARRSVDAAAGLVRDLEELQTRLGDLHDVDVLTDLVRTAIGTAHDAPAGLVSMDRLVAIHRATLVDRLREEWLEGRAATLIGDLAGLAGALGADPVHLPEQASART